jgi:transketolase
VFTITRTVSELKDISREIRKDIVTMISEAGSGHPGGSLSITDILTYLYFQEMKHDPGNICWEDRDRLILSKGHAAPSLYATLARAGYISLKECAPLRETDCILQGHPDTRFLPCVEVSTGSLGMGLGLGAGLALSLKLDNKNSFVYVIMGDGESQEGMVWEAALFASKCGLGKLILFLDSNNLQIDGKVSEVMPMEPVVDKWRAFNWQVLDIDGHDFDAIGKAIAQAKEEKGRPTIIVARTVKGKGVSFMENVVKFHGTAPNKEELKIALEELDGQ